MLLVACAQKLSDTSVKAMLRLLAEPLVPCTDEDFRRYRSSITSFLDIGTSLNLALAATAGFRRNLNIDERRMVYTAGETVRVVSWRESES